MFATSPLPQCDSDGRVSIIASKVVDCLCSNDEVPIVFNNDVFAVRNGSDGRKEQNTLYDSEGAEGESDVTCDDDTIPDTDYISTRCDTTPDDISIRCNTISDTDISTRCDTKGDSSNNGSEDMIQQLKVMAHLLLMFTAG